MLNRSDKLFTKALKLIQEKGNFRSLPQERDYKLDFTSNNYLDIPIPFKSSKLSQSKGSRLLGGNHSTLVETEKILARFFDAPEALLMNSGYVANLAFWAHVPQKGDLVLYDKKVHASIRDGIQLGKAKSYSFKHNDFDDLVHKFQSHRDDFHQVFVAVESVYSMDGDRAPLQELSQWCEENEVFLVVDEAHGVGTSYPSGKGWCLDMGLASKIPFRLVTLGKGLGLHGAVWLGTSDFKTYMVNTARSFIYTTSLPASLFDIEWETYFQVFEERINDLHVLMAKLEKAPWLKGWGHTPIKYIPCPSSEKAVELQNRLAEKGIRAQAVRPPTVLPGEERLRICIRATHQLHDFEELKKALEL